MAQVVWLTRHGNRQDFVDPDWTKTAERPHDPALSPDGIEQAKRLGQRLRGEGIEHLFASPFLRCVETAHHVAEVIDLPIYLEPGVAEWMNTEWFPTFPRTLPPEVLAEQFERVDLSYSPRAFPDYPETEEAAMERAGRTARELADAYERPILIVGHGVSVAGAASGLVEGVSIQSCALCSLFKIVRERQSWTMEVTGDVSHLDEAKAADRFS